MSSESSTLGQEWNGALARTTTPSFDLAVNQRAFADLQAHLEKSARSVVTQLIDEEVRAGIMSCTERGSNAVGLQVPATALQTEAFEQFRLWLKAQGLACAVAEFEPDAKGVICACLSIQPQPDAF